MHPFKVNDVEIGSDRAYVVAEMAWSHDGKKELALDIVHAAGRAGADCISVHITDVPAYMVPHYGSGEGRVSAGKDAEKIFRYLCDVNIRDEWWPDIVAAARENKLAVAVMPNDFPSLALARGLNPDIYVLSAACFVEEAFVRAVAAEKRPLLLRVGGATLGEIEQVLGLLAEEGATDYVLLWGQQNYPTKIEDTDLRKLVTLRDTFDAWVGLADHVDADDPLAMQIPLMSLPLGACVIEKHLTHDRAKKGEDFESALNPDELAQFVINLRKAEKALGCASFAGLSTSQRKYRSVARKRVVAARDLGAGHVLTAEDVTCKRGDEGEFPDRLPLIVGRKLQVEAVENQGLTLQMLG